MKIISIILLVAAPACAWELPAVNVAAIRAMPAEMPAVSAPARPAAERNSQSVYMNVTASPYSKEASANDWNSRIQTTVRATGTSRFDVKVQTEQAFDWASINKNGNYYNLFSSAFSLNMSGSNGSYFINGNVYDNGKSSFVSTNVSCNKDNSYCTVFGGGLSITASAMTLNGWYDENQYSKKAVAGVASMLMALRVEGMQQPK